MSHSFGGDWTQEKLERVRKYLSAYTTLMKGNERSRHLRIAYIDAFAGTGYRTLRQDQDPNSLMLPLLAEPEPQQFLDGSARIALKVEPQFDKYIFIEKDEKRFQELRKLEDEFQALKSKITLIKQDANTYLTDLCQNYNWSNNRAVLFLDPYGMQVDWQTIQAIARTKAIDLWYLFPMGVAVNRLLKKNGQINEDWQQSLNRIFGEAGWYDEFYKSETTPGLFGEETRINKTSDFASSIQMYFIKRLKTVFPSVAENPLTLYNSRNNPLYLLCFASANEKGGPTAIKIAQHILRR